MSEGPGERRRVPADLDAIVAAARSGVLRPTRHYAREREGRADRPPRADIMAALRDGGPVIFRDDRGAEDARGAVCMIVCRAPSGRKMVVRVNYERRPMRVVTAYWLPRDR